MANDDIEATTVRYCAAVGKIEVDQTGLENIITSTANSISIDGTAVQTWTGFRNALTTSFGTFPAVVAADAQKAPLINLTGTAYVLNYEPDWATAGFAQNTTRKRFFHVDNVGGLISFNQRVIGDGDDASNVSVPVIITRTALINGFLTSANQLLALSTDTPIDGTTALAGNTVIINADRTGFTTTGSATTDSINVINDILPTTEKLRPKGDTTTTTNILAENSLFVANTNRNGLLPLTLLQLLNRDIFNQVEDIDLLTATARRGELISIPTAGGAKLESNPIRHHFNTIMVAGKRIGNIGGTITTDHALANTYPIVNSTRTGFSTETALEIINRVFTTEDILDSTARRGEVVVVSTTSGQARLETEPRANFGTGGGGGGSSNRVFWGFNLDRGLLTIICSVAGNTYTVEDYETYSFTQAGAEWRINATNGRMQLQFTEA